MTNYNSFYKLKNACKLLSNECYNRYTSISKVKNDINTPGKHFFLNLPQCARVMSMQAQHGHTGTNEHIMGKKTIKSARTPGNMCTYRRITGTCGHNANVLITYTFCPECLYRHYGHMLFIM